MWVCNCWLYNFYVYFLWMEFVFLVISYCLLCMIYIVSMYCLTAWQMQVTWNSILFPLCVLSACYHGLWILIFCSATYTSPTFSVSYNVVFIFCLYNSYYLKLFIVCSENTTVLCAMNPLTDYVKTWCCLSSNFNTFVIKIWCANGK